jgi:hypothetical protein
MIILKNHTSKKNFVRCSGAVKAHSETKMKSPLLETIIYPVRYFVALTQVTKYMKIILQTFTFSL